MFRYLNCTMKYMVWSFEKNGVSKKDIDVKVFGGSDILITPQNGSMRKSVGKQNIEMAKKILHNERMEAKIFHVGGSFGRKIYFFTDSGEIFMKRIKKSLLQKEAIEI